MNLKCVIVEDLQVAADYLTRCCEKSGQVDVQAHFPNVQDALVYLNQHSVDLLFLDVEMPGATGFDLLDQLAYFPKVVLTTSKPEYAYDAFEYNVTDFLKKPFTYQRFLESLQKLTSATTENNIASTATDHIFIKSDGKLVRLNNDDILYIESMGDYVKFVTGDKKYVTHNTIKNLEEKVNKQCFIKVHRSYIINIDKIDDIRENDLFIKGNEIPISKAHRGEVMKRLNII
ncbi:response regulator transcription factor [Pseudoflavitalea sp. X16]|jgi:DNA-binding LytR/AlgR family response regulator|uniref:LytR/AlgR family response regulator transcription factor n=1 Tax=Paraflavitalea devenefica TaxID=2716334 RepID=UPI001420849E|nr:LytTR family DNA-binding domain-containing protein [Paraflavitalea devenefica]NII25308.1 response regulator transcription factor [Paraflavitalea devenefica]